MAGKHHPHMAGKHEAAFDKKAMKYSFKPKVGLSCYNRLTHRIY